MSNKAYDNFFLSNEVEDQFNSHLDLQRFCTIDSSLEGTVGMKKIINTYRATDEDGNTSFTEKLTVGEGNTKAIEVTYEPSEYDIALAQNRFAWYDEDAMKDDNLVPVGMKHAGTDMFNTVNADIYAELKKTRLQTPAGALGFDSFVDAISVLDVENDEELEVFAFVSADNKGKLRKALKDDLKYVEAYARTGYIGTVAGVNIYTKKDAGNDEIIVATKEAVTIFTKKGTEIEDERDANIRKNTVYSRKYYVVALTNEAKAVRIPLTA